MLSCPSRLARVLMLGTALLGPAASADAPPVETLRAIHARRDPARSVRIEGAPERLRIGRDSLRFTVSADRDGYVYVLMAGSDGRALTLLLPNARDADNRLRAGQPLALPRPGWRFHAAGPTGADHLLVMVSAEPRDFGHLAPRRQGPFRSLDAATLRARGIRVTRDIAGCAGSLCAFGSALLTVREDP